MITKNIPRSRRHSALWPGRTSSWVPGGSSAPTRVPEPRSRPSRSWCRPSRNREMAPKDRWRAHTWSTCWETFASYLCDQMLVILCCILCRLQTWQDEVSFSRINFGLRIRILYRYARRKKVCLWKYTHIYVWTMVWSQLIGILSLERWKQRQLKQ